MIDKRIVGRETPPHRLEVEKRRARDFARAIGDDNPIQVDEKAVKESGFRSLPAPPACPFLA